MEVPVEEFLEGVAGGGFGGGDVGGAGEVDGEDDRAAGGFELVEAAVSWAGAAEDGGGVELPGDVVGGEGVLRVGGVDHDGDGFGEGGLEGDKLTISGAYYLRVGEGAEDAEEKCQLIASEITEAE